MQRNITPPNLPGKISPKVVGIIIVVAILLVILFSSFYTVDQTEEAVILLFGKFNRMEGPGLHTKIPFGIEQNLNVATGIVHKEEFGFRTVLSGVETVYDTNDYTDEAQMLTGDLNIIEVEWIIQYYIVDAKAWLFGVEDKTTTIRDISQSVLNLLVGDRRILGVMGSDRESIEVQAVERMNKRFSNYNLGIRVDAVKLQDVLPPEGEVQAAFEDVNKAEQDKERLINEGREAYNQAIPQAEGEAKRVTREAEGYASERINQALGDVARFKAVLTQYRKSPNVTQQRLYIEMYEEVFGSGSGTDLIDRNLNNFIPFKAFTDTAPAGGGQ